MSRRIVAVVLLAAGLSGPAFAQTVGEVCEAQLKAFRTDAVAVSRQAADVAAALEARAGLAAKEAAAREKCQIGGYYYLAPIDVTKEDLDIALATAVPSCKAYIDLASPHVVSAQKLRGFPDKARAAIETLVRLRGEAAEPCKDYPGVMGRMLRAENTLISNLPPPPVQRGRP